MKSEFYIAYKCCSHDQCFRPISSPIYYLVERGDCVLVFIMNHNEDKFLGVDTRLTLWQQVTLREYLIRVAYAMNR